MTDRYCGTLKCPHCNKDTNFFYADEWSETGICELCEKKYLIKLKFIAEKLK